MGLLDFMLQLKKRKNKTYLKKGAIILDVRENDELKKGRIKDSMHIPLNDLQQNVENIKALQKPIIVVCERGGRAAKAVDFLKMKNLDAINGGGWKSVNKYL